MPGKKLENVNPNRMELLILHRRINLAKKGHKLLSEKRDAMVMQFMKILQSYEETRDRTLDKLQNAYDTLTQVEMLMGEIRLEDLQSLVRCQSPRLLQVFHNLDLSQCWMW